MGYRSEVVLAISKKMVPHFMVTMAQEPQIRELVFKHTDKLDQDYDGEGGWMMHWEHIKWYESYPPIACIENFISDCESESLEGLTLEDETEEREREYSHFRFVRLGEEFDDVEQKGEFCWDSIHLERSVTF